MNDVISNFISSGISGGIAEMITFPFCTVKTIYQSNTNFKKVRDVFKVIYIGDGLRGFYKGMGPAIASQVLTSSMRYPIYQELKKYNNGNTLAANILNGAMGGLFASIVTHPIDVIKIELQNKIFDFNKFIKGGFKHWYKAYNKTFAKIIITSSLYMPLYDSVNHYFKNKLMASLVVGIISVTISHPIDLFKVRQIGSGEKIYIKNIYRGLSMNLLRLVPHFTIYMTMIETIKEFI